MIRGLLVFFAVWAAVFFGISYFWHTSRETKFNMAKAGFYSLMTAFIALALLTVIVVIF